GHSDNVDTLAWSPDGKRIASGSDDETVQVWNAFDGKKANTHSGPAKEWWDWGRRAVHALAWSPDSQYIASGGTDGTVQIWRATDGKQILTYKGHSGGETVNAIAWSPDGQRIASGSKDGTVQVWNPANGKLIYTYQGHISHQSILGLEIPIPNTSPVLAVAWSPDSKRIASASTDDTVQVWDALDGKDVYTYRGHTEDVNTVAWSPDGQYL